MSILCVLLLILYKFSTISILTVKFKYLESEKIEILEWRDTSSTITTDNPLHLKVRFYSDYGPVVIEIRKKFYRNGSWLVPRDYETYGLKYIGADGKVLGEIYASSDFDNCKTCNYYMTSSPEFEAAIDEIDNYTEQCLRSNAFILPALEKL